MTTLDGEEPDLLSIFQPRPSEEEEITTTTTTTTTNNPTTTTIEQTTDQTHHHLRSTNTTLTIRQITSRGLSFQLWPAASTLLSLLDQPNTTPVRHLISSLPLPHPPPLRLLELGSGTGLAGISAAATLPASVTLTDLPHVLPNLTHNADANISAVRSLGGDVRVRPLRWGNGDDDDHRSVSEEFGGFDVVMASDVVYYDSLFEPLLETLRFFVVGEVVLVMAHLRRWKKDSVFFGKARRFFDVKVIHSDPPLPGSRKGVTVYSFKQRRK
ncbi:hypothetical protein QJS04_geneDACA005373 [Acorus gramineus]|uniref:Uncharacterized protein n=1 Tax=Acorus gramineus TaxID=55184 RepID=A0AAV9AZR7_ACOGR|nr:hypothetical protein QJS04_geneDACA005373 [Acorus gramineus]